MPNLPSHRQFLTSLITHLTTTTQPQDEEPYLFPPSSRPLLLTLHALFPNLVLPALDLLDRRLVTHLSLAETETEGEQEENRTQTYFVKSLATTIVRRHGATDSAASKKSYVVSLGAWNCSCASFAFDAFPASVEESTATGIEDTESWEFGGMSLDGLSGIGEDVPCCKHLLACLLADQWSGHMGIYVNEREISKEEYAGTVAGL